MSIVMDTQVLVAICAVVVAGASVVSTAVLVRLLWVAKTIDRVIRRQEWR